MSNLGNEKKFWCVGVEKIREILTSDICENSDVLAVLEFENFDIELTDRGYSDGERHYDYFCCKKTDGKKCMHGDYAVKDLYHINEYVDKYIEETVGTPYKIDKNTLLKEIGYWYGDYSEEDGLYIIDNGIKKFTYTNVRDGLKDWLSTLKQDVDTDWKNEIEFIEGLK